MSAHPNDSAHSISHIKINNSSSESILFNPQFGFDKNTPSDTSFPVLTIRLDMSSPDKKPQTPTPGNIVPVKDNDDPFCENWNEDQQFFNDVLGDAFDEEEKPEATLLLPEKNPIITPAFNTAHNKEEKKEDLQEEDKSVIIDDMLEKFVVNIMDNLEYNDSSFDSFKSKNSNKSQNNITEPIINKPLESRNEKSNIDKNVIQNSLNIVNVPQTAKKEPLISKIEEIILTKPETQVHKKPEYKIQTNTIDFEIIVKKEEIKTENKPIENTSEKTITNPKTCKNDSLAEIKFENKKDVKNECMPMTFTNIKINTPEKNIQKAEISKEENKKPEINEIENSKIITKKENTTANLENISIINEQKTENCNEENKNSEINKSENPKIDVKNENAIINIKKVNSTVKKAEICKLESRIPSLKEEFTELDIKKSNIGCEIKTEKIPVPPEQKKIDTPKIEIQKDQVKQKIKKLSNKIDQIKQEIKKEEIQFTKITNSNAQIQETEFEKSSIPIMENSSEKIINPQKTLTAESSNLKNISNPNKTSIPIMKNEPVKTEDLQCEDDQIVVENVDESNSPCTSKVINYKLIKNDLKSSPDQNAIRIFKHPPSRQSHAKNSRKHSIHKSSQSHEKALNFNEQPKEEHHVIISQKFYTNHEGDNKNSLESSQELKQLPSIQKSILKKKKQDQLSFTLLDTVEAPKIEIDEIIHRKKRRNKRKVKPPFKTSKTITRTESCLKPITHIKSLSTSVFLIISLQRFYFRDQQFIIIFINEMIMNKIKLLGRLHKSNKFMQILQRKILHIKYPKHKTKALIFKTSFILIDAQKVMKNLLGIV